MERIVVLMLLLGALAGAACAEESNPFDVQPTVVVAPQAWTSSPYDPPPGPATGPDTLKWRAVPRDPAPVGTGVSPVPGLMPPSVAPRPIVTYRPVLPTPLPTLPAPIAYEVGRSVWGQPTLYAPGQPIRNFLRWLTP
jgi:hypothetical protein